MLVPVKPVWPKEAAVNQIARAERLLHTLPTDQKPAFEALLKQSVRDRDEIQTELYDIYKTLDELTK
jgi:hypothetical protein